MELPPSGGHRLDYPAPVQCSTEIMFFGESRENEVRGAIIRDGAFINSHATAEQKLENLGLYEAPESPFQNI